MTKQKDKKHDPHDLTDALEHVVYEMWKYKQSVVCYPRILSAGGDAALEFRVLHHRVLLEFFHGPQKHKDNIVAWEYIADWQETHKPEDLPWLRSYMKRCHTMLAHISTTRAEMAKLGLKDWAEEWSVVEPYLDKSISGFLRKLPQNHKDICLRRIDKWLNGNHPGKEALMGLRALIPQP